MKAIVAALALTLITAGCAHDGMPREILIPDVTSQNTSDAIAALQNAGFTALRTQYMPSTTTPPEKVIKTIPPLGQRVAVTTSITLVVSTGPIQRSP